MIETLIGGLLRAEDVVVACLVFNEGRLAEAVRSLSVQVTVVPESGRSFAALVRATREAIASCSPDVLHCHRYKELLLAVLARGRRNLPIVMTIHGLEPREQLALRPFLLVWSVLALGRLCRVRFTAVSSELRERLARSWLSIDAVHVPNSIPVMPEPSESGFDLRERFGWRPDDPVVGFVGRLEPVKGPDRFIALAQNQSGRARFLLIGGGSMAESLRLQAASAGLSGRLAFTGEVPSAPPLLRQLDVLAIPSRHEGMPVVLLEAASARIPVVAFAVGDVTQVMSAAPSDWVVPPDDIAGLSRALERVLADLPRAKRQAAEWAQDVASRFSLDAVTARYRALYASARRPGQRGIGLADGRDDGRCMRA